PINIIHPSSRRIESRHILLPCRSIVTYSQYSRFQRILYQRYPKAHAMQRRKIVIATLSLLLVGLALPTANINKAHAFTTGNNSLIIGNTYSGPSLPPGIASGTIVQGGSRITVNAAIAGSLFNDPAFLRNVIVRYMFIWQLY